MNDHVAVLREMREHLAIFAEGAEGARRRGMDGDLAALDFAITACEQHAALVARLGELPKFTPMSGCMVADRGGEWISADDLARVVKENDDGR